MSASGHSITSPSCLTSAPVRPAVRRYRPPRWRTYADVHHGNDSTFRDNMHWPAPKTPPVTPTPYEIFALPKGGAYSKHKFYELVKIYHPDRHGLEGTACAGISHVEKLERYRLVVLAHEILSDPIKRKAYDSYGAGWGSFERQSTKHSRGYYSTSAGKPFGFGEGYETRHSTTPPGRTGSAGTDVASLTTSKLTQELHQPQRIRFIRHTDGCHHGRCTSHESRAVFQQLGRKGKRIHRRDKSLSNLTRHTVQRA